MDYIVFYGTLMRGFPTQAHLGLEGMVRYAGPCRVPGLLYDLGQYPGLRPGPGLVRAELYEVVRPEAVAALDRFEDFHPDDPGASEYLRQLVPLREPELSAWVYVLAREPRPHEPLIDSGCWATHFRQNKGGEGYWRRFLGGRP